MNIIGEKEQPLLSRKEVIAELVYEKVTPSNPEIKKQLVSSLKAKENLVVVKKIITEFGSRNARIIAYVYENEEAMKRIEPKQKKKKGDKKEALKEKKEDDKEEE